jgi:outer membrane receptor protein involved in Fe transport
MSLRWPWAADVKHLFVLFSALFVMYALLNSAVNAQTSKGILVGTVRDPDGAALAGASLMVISQETGETRHVTSDAQGDFRIEAISPGVYSIHVEAAGFEAVDVKHLTIVPSAVTSYQPILRLGKASTTVEVEATGNQINTENAQLSETLGSAELGNLPIFSLNPIELAATLPGVQFVNDTSLAIQGAGGNFEHIEVNGARPRANNFMLDGQDINDVGLGGQAFGIVIPDIFQSETVITNNPSAEYGRAGGAIVNLITKAGTNDFHGSAFELYSGSGLNATDGQTRQVTPKSSANKARADQHQIGFTFGGPVVKKKLFAFGSSQWSRFYGKSSSTQIELPDAAGYATLTSIGGPQVALLQELLGGGSYLSQYLYQANQGVVEALNVGQQNGCPAGGCVITTGSFLRPPVDQQSPDTQWIVRTDYLPNEKDTFTVRYLHDFSNFNPDLGLNTSGLPGFDGEVGGPSEFGGMSWTHVLSPRLVNELRGSITRVNILFQATPSASANPASTLPTLSFLDNGMPNLGLSQNIPQGTKENYYQYQDTISWTLGKQSFRIGADVGRILESDLVAQLSIGEVFYAQGAGNSGLGNFLFNQTGPSGSVEKTFGPTRIDPHTWRTAFFAQDDIKLTPALTLNLGLRYDYLTDPGNSLRYPAVDTNNLSAPIDSVFRIKTDKANWGPRIGFAYAPNGFGWLGTGKTVFHGGAGIYYDTSFSNIVTNTAQAAPNAPTGLLEVTSGGGVQNPIAAIGTITPDLSPTDAVFSISKDIVNPSTYEWNLGFERSLPEDLKLAINYVGSRGRRLYANQHLNYFDFNTGERLLADRGAIDIRENSAASQYDSVQTEVTRSFKHGLFVRGAYTYGKNLDDGSEVFALFSGPTSYPADPSPGGRKLDWGPSSFDFRHYLSIDYVWSPVGLHSEKRMANALLGAVSRNWTVSGLTQLQSGPPSTFNFEGIDSNGDGSTTNDRPIVGNGIKPLNTAGIDGIYLGAPTPGQYYDVGALNGPGTIVPVTPDQVHWLIPFGPQFVQQEIGRNSYRNPGSTVWNMAVQKDIPARWTHRENAAFNLRCEASDVGNHNDVGILDTNLLHINSGNSYLNPATKRLSTARNVRFWAKFTF